MCNEIAAHEIQQLLAIVAARIMIAGGDEVAEESDVARLDRGSQRRDRRANLRLGIVVAATHSEEGGRQSERTEPREFHALDCSVRWAQNTTSLTTREHILLALVLNGGAVDE